MTGKLLTPIELDILTYLSKQNVCHGGEIMANINKKREIFGFPVTQYGVFSPVLARLDERKLITSSWGEGSQGARRKYHQITSLGAKTLKINQEYRKSIEGE